MWDSPSAMNRLASALFGLAAALTIAALAVLAAQLPAFALREVRIVGEIEHVTRNEIVQVVGRELRGNFFTVNLEATRAALERLPWVRLAEVRRGWPPRLDVTLEEHDPLARWAEGGLVSAHGVLFDAAHDAELPLFSGPPGAAREMTIQYRYFLRTLEPTGERPVAVSLNERRAWTLRLSGGFTLALGRQDVEARLARFAGAYARTLGALGRSIDYVDLRYAHGFAVRIPGLRGEPSPPKPGRARDAGKA